MDFQKLKEAVLKKGIMTEKAFKKFIIRFLLFIFASVIALGYIGNLILGNIAILAILAIALFTIFTVFSELKDNTDFIITVNKVVGFWWLPILIMILAIVVLKLFLNY